MHPLLPTIVALLLCSGCSSFVPAARNPGELNEVIVLGMIHGDHRTSANYGVDQLRQIVTEINPDYVLTEIPPDRWPLARSQFIETGAVLEPRVKVFPEYTDVILPLTQELDLEIIPCAAWTQEMAADRRSKLAAWKTSRAEEYQEMVTAQKQASQKIETLGADDPVVIHSSAYDDIVRRGMEPYNRHFNAELGLGGWDNINAAHYALIAEQLDRHSGQGKRFLITFGAWHKYWFLEQLNTRSDIVVRTFSEAVTGSGN